MSFYQRELEIHRKFARMGLKSREDLWSKKDLKILREGYKKLRPVSELVEELGRSENAIRLKASRMGLSRMEIMAERFRKMVTS